MENNLAFQKYNEKDDDLQGAGCTLCVLKFVRSNPVEINNNTVVRNNIADRANGGKNKWGKGTFPVAGRVVENNEFKANISQEITDHKNFDFRPVKGSEAALRGIGPYAYEEKMSEYWIPGRQIYKASTPVPIDGSVTVKSSRRDTIMFLQGYGCRKHIVYFGRNKKLVQNAQNVENPSYAGTLENGSNVFYLPNTLNKLAIYYWRVDAVTSKGVVYKGDLWSFTTK